MYALMKVIAKFSLEELKCIPELLPCTSRPCGWTVPRKCSANVSKPSAMDTTVHKVKPEAKGIACNLFDAIADHLKQLDFISLRQCQIQLSKINPMIPFVNSIRNERDVLSTDLTETKYGKYSIFSPLSQQVPIYGENCQKNVKKCQMYVYSGHALSYTKLVHRHATQTEGNKYFK